MSRAALEAHYRLERGLADQLRTADKDARRSLYQHVYDRLNRESPLYAERRAAPDTSGKARGLARLVAFVERFLPRQGTVLEVGPGDAALSYALAPRVREVIAVDVSREALTAAPAPPNFRFLLTDGFGLPVPDASVDLVISNQLMEHLHPDDAFEQLQSVLRALRPGGAYVCITPSRLNGPHDVSKHFDPIATGLHLKEYTVGELATIFRRAGFVRLSAYAGTKGRFVRLPVGLVAALEAVVEPLPPKVRRALAKFWPLRAAFGVRLCGHRPV